MPEVRDGLNVRIESSTESRHTDKHKVTQELKAKDVVSWEFRTEKHDLSFAVTGTVTKEIVKAARVDCAKTTQTGSYVADSDETLEFLWDNSYSRWTCKEIQIQSLACTS